MHIRLRFEYVNGKDNRDDNESHTCRCPFGDHEATIQYEDYVDIPMMWCYKCGASSFLDEDEFDAFTTDVDTIETEYWSLDEAARSAFTKCVERDVLLLFVESMTDHIMAQYASPRPLTYSEMVTLTLVGRPSSDSYGHATMDTLGVTVRSYDDSETAVPYENISVPVRRYAILPVWNEDAHVNYSHDGVTIHAVVRAVDGTTRRVAYWGD